jgi:hypothetical protein
VTSVFPLPPWAAGGSSVPQIVEFRKALLPLPLRVQLNSSLSLSYAISLIFLYSDLAKKSVYFYSAQF